MAALIILSLIAANTGISYAAPFNDPKSVITIVVLIVVWVMVLMGHLA